MRRLLGPRQIRVKVVSKEGWGERSVAFQFGEKHLAHQTKMALHWVLISPISMALDQNICMVYSLIGKECHFGN
jgi:hypothetical protein